MTPLIVIQARLGSKRLPSKILLLLAGKPVLQHVVERCQRTGYRVVVACPYDDWGTIAGTIQNVPIASVQCDPADVLRRYQLCVAMYHPVELVVRITADCPLVDPELIEAAVQAIREGADYAGNTVERHWPRGCDVEAFTTDLLMQAHESATDPYDREHVTPWMQRWAANAIALEAPSRPLDASNEDRWTIDHLGDYRWFKRLWELFPEHPNGPSLEETASAIARGAIQRHLDTTFGAA